MTHSMRRRLAASAGAGAALAVVAAAPGLGAQDATLRLTGASPAFPTAVAVTRPDGTTVNVRPSRYHYTLATPAGAAFTVPAQASGFCVDTSHYIVSGRDYAVSLQTEADDPAMATDAYREAGWLVAHSQAAIAAAPDPQLEAAAHQVSVWALTGQIRDGASPTGNARINARVAELRALAAGKRLPDVLDVTMGTPDSCLGNAAPVTVTGTPGEVVDLAAPEGATVVPARVELDQTGTATAVVSNDHAGSVTITARADAPRAVRATRHAGVQNPQDQLFVVPGTLTDSVTHTFLDCQLAYAAPGAPERTLGTGGGPLLTAPATPSPSPAAPAPPPVAAAPAPAALPGGTTTFTVTVRNTSRRAARGVVVRQTLRDGLAATSASGTRRARAAVRAGAVRWTVPLLPAGAVVRLRVTAHVPASLRGDLGRADVRVTGLGRAASVRVSAPVLEPVAKEDQGF
ncbi:MAG: DUF11 domain-containing protein [Thermoleophilia bacterium]|nr:DUF11 domain-containing protein [Thermoleophilia bacterium]